MRLPLLLAALPRPTAVHPLTRRSLLTSSRSITYSTCENTGVSSISVSPCDADPCVFTAGQ